MLVRTPGRSPSGARRGPRPRTAAAVACAGFLLAAACSGRSAGDAPPGSAEPAEPLPRADRGQVVETPAPTRPAGPSPLARLLGSAVADLDSSGHGPATRALAEVRYRCGPSPLGSRATLVLAALHLDPTNPGADPQRAAGLAAEYLLSGDGPRWTRPLARVLYLEALEMGAEPAADAAPAEGRRRSSGSPWGSAHVPEACRASGEGPPMTNEPGLPRLPGAALTSRLEQLRARVAALEDELERIREILDEP